MHSIKNVNTEELKRQWDEWCETDSEDITSLEFVDWYYDDIHLELNLRGEGEYCAV